jgi:serine/threonine protein kinase
MHHGVRGQQNQGQQEGLLCYEFLPDGNLEDRLYGGRGAKLTWKERCHILNGICSGLQYLHNESPICIIHMDLKTDSILLQVHEDKKNGGILINPKISDFGISRNHNTDKQHEYVGNVVGNVEVAKFKYTYCPARVC